MNSTGWVVAIVVLLIIIGGGWWWYSMQNPAPATTNTTAVGNVTDQGTSGTDTNATATTNTEVGVNAGTNAANTTTVHYTASGFSPKSVTINKGQSVSFVDDTQNPMWVAANNHPTHTSYDGTDRATHCSGSYSGPTPFDQCQPGSTYTFVFGKAGTFGYHNHAAAQFEGTVTVK
jgi:plastocyanin